MAWPSVQFNGETYRQSEGIVLVPESGSGMAVIMIRENGGVMGGVSAIEQGPPGAHAAIDTTVVVTDELEYDDATPASASWTELVPPTTETPGLYRYNTTQRKGRNGEDGDTVLNIEDFDGGSAGDVITVNDDEDGFELTAPRITEVFYPTEINTGSSSGTFLLAEVTIPPRPWARRLAGEGFSIVTGDASNVRVNLLARIGSSGGNIIGRCVGIAQTERLTMSPGKPIEAGTVSDSYDTIAAGASTVINIQCERVGGSTSYTPSAGQFRVVALPL